MVEGRLERCINQVFRPKTISVDRPEGIGDCYYCQYDPIKNKDCKGYYPISISVYEVTKQYENKV
jgi:hypothetical protein